MIIKNGISSSGYGDLLLQKDKFAFQDATGQLKLDGPTMAFLMFQKVDPNTVVGMDSVLKRMESAKLGDYGNDVDKMLSHMEQSHKILQDNQRPPENYRRLLLDSLITGPNHVFNEWIQRITDDIEAGFGPNVNVPADKIIIASRTKYNNMCEKKEWSKVDPRNAQIMALSTKLEELTANTQNTEEPEDKEKTANTQNTEEPEDKEQEKTTSTTLEIEGHIKQFLISDLRMSEEEVDELFIFRHASGN